MGRRMIGLLAGVLAGVVVVFGMEMISLAMHPLPEGVDPYDPADRDALIAHIRNLPASAFAIVLTAHAAGAFAAGAVCSLASGFRNLIGGAVLGAFFLAAGVFNLLSLPHPTWFAVVDIPLYVPLALAGAFVASTRPPPHRAGPQDDGP